MKRIIFSLVGVAVLIAMGLAAASPPPASATETTIVFQDDFGTTEYDTVPGWTDSDGSGWDAAIRLYSGNGYLRLRSAQW